MNYTEKEWIEHKKKYSDTFKNVDNDLRTLSRTLRKMGCIVMSNTPPQEPLSELYIHKDNRSVMFQFNGNWKFIISGEDDSELFNYYPTDKVGQLPKRLEDGKYIIRFLLDHGVEEDKQTFKKGLGPYKKVVENITLKDYLENRIIQN